MASNAIGLFQDPGTALAAARRLKEAGFAGLDLISPIPLEGVEEVLGEKRSAIKRFTFFGALTGTFFGFFMAAGTAVLYVHPTGGRPIIPFPPYLVIAYEMTILFGILATVLGFLVSSRLPAIRDRAYVPEAGVDKFAVSVSCDDGEGARRAAAILGEAGALEVRGAAEG